MDITQIEHVRSSVFVSDGIVIVDLFESLYYLLLFPAFKKKVLDDFQRFTSKMRFYIFLLFLCGKSFSLVILFCIIKNETISVKQ